ncbi:MAG: hypothetical protein JXR37_31210 [Kiritimatiellae bacterium]|nr:hypothetical protein [Kiritimatiellia bacterium]
MPACQTRPVITLIGAGSRVFGFNMCTDICQTPPLKGAEVRLVDLNADKLKSMHRLFELVSRSTGMGLRVSSHTDRREALSGSDFVILSVAVQRIDRWETDLAISRKHGIAELQGECGGPGGLSLTLRNIPPILDIAYDIEALAPNAVLLNFSNPMTRVCLAVNRHTRVRTVGLCHGLLSGQNMLGRLLGRQMVVHGCGINHFNWISGAKWADTRENAWPEVAAAFRAARAEDIPKWLYVRELFEVFGRVPSPDDRHIADFVHHWGAGQDGVNRRYRTSPKEMHAYREQAVQWERRIASYLSGEKDPMAGRKGLSGEGAIPIICAMWGLAPPYEEISVNIPNRGSITNLPHDAIVEVPARVSPGSLEGVPMRALPPGIRSLIARQLEIADLAVEAAVHGDRDKALEALVLDPLVTDLAFARAYLDDILQAHADLLPRFAAGQRSEEPAPALTGRTP